MEKAFIGENIKNIRKVANLSQAKFGSALGFSARTVSDWESGNTEPDITTIKKISKVFNVSYEDILDWFV